MTKKIKKIENLKKSFLITKYCLYFVLILAQCIEYLNKYIYNVFITRFKSFVMFLKDVSNDQV